MNRRASTLRGLALALLGALAPLAPAATTSPSAAPAAATSPSAAPAATPVPTYASVPASASIRAFASAPSSAPAAVQTDQPSVAARLSTGVVKLGGRAQLEIVVENASTARIVEVPAADGLAIAPFGQPSRQQSMFSYNGRVQTSVRLTFVTTVRPGAEGEYTIPPITLEVDGRPLTTRALPLKAVVDVQGEDFGFIEVVEVPEVVYDGQPFQLVMRFGFDAGLGVNRAVLHLPWWGELPGTIALEDPPRALGGDWIEIAVNRTETIQVEETGAEERDGRPFRTFWLRKNFMATRPGTLELPTSYLEFGRTDRLGRARETWYAHEEPIAIEVRALPEEGRPYDYTNAVGSFTAQASVDRRDVDVGESIKLSVDYSGEGNLEWFDPPDPARDEAFADFRFYGRTERKRVDSRRVTWDLAPRTTAVREIPPVRLRVFDPELGAYSTVATEPIPVRVRAIEGGEGLAETSAAEFGLDVRDVQGPAAVSAPIQGPGGRAVGLALLLVPALWLAGRTAVRRHGEPDAPERRRRRAARRRLARGLAGARSASEEARALHRFLADRTLEPEGAWIGRDARAWQREHAERLGADEAAALAELLARLDERVYAGGDEPLGAREVLGVADRVCRGGL